MTQGELFPLPEGHVPRPPKRRTAGITYARFKPTRRRLCMDCIALIHRYGQAGAPYPLNVRWRRQEGIDVRFLCEPHVRERQEAEK